MRVFKRIYVVLIQKSSRSPLGTIMVCSWQPQVPGAHLPWIGEFLETILCYFEPRATHRLWCAPVGTTNFGKSSKVDIIFEHVKLIFEKLKFERVQKKSVPHDTLCHSNGWLIDFTMWYPAFIIRKHLTSPCPRAPVHPSMRAPGLSSRPSLRFFQVPSSI